MTSLRTKLTVLLAIPLGLLVLSASFGVRSASQARAETDESADQLALVLSSYDTALALIQEQRLSAVAAYDSAADVDVEAQRAQTDARVEQLTAALGARPEADQAGTPAAAASSALDALGSARSTATGDAAVTDVVDSYTAVVTPILRLGDDLILNLSTDPATVRALSSVQALTNVVQATSVQDGVIRDALINENLDGGAREAVEGAISAETLWTTRFYETATPQQAEEFDEVASTRSVTTADELRDSILAAAPELPDDATPALWSSSMDRKLDLLVEATTRAANRADAVGSSDGADARGDLVMAWLLLLATVAGSALLALAVYRLVIRPISALAHASQEAAEDLIAAATSDALADDPDAVRPLPLPPDDELSDMADAFNSAQETAGSLARQQGSIRGDAQQVFLNFGRRAQNLITRQLGQIDDLESRTDDPDMLSDLFALDHLATRLRRNAEAMVVVAGAESPRPWARPVSVVNVLRAAAAEATDYSRIDVGTVAPGAVAGAAANDVSHLLAELIDNALTYSPPESRVTVAGAPQHGAHYLVTVTDAGLGMPPSQLAKANDALAGSSAVPDRRSEPPETGGGNGNGSSKGGARSKGGFGLHIVQQLAQRHGIAVRLSPSYHNGIQVSVLLPRTIMALPGDSMAGALTFGEGSDSAAVTPTGEVAAVSHRSYGHLIPEPEATPLPGPAATPAPPPAGPPTSPPIGEPALLDSDDFDQQMMPVSGQADETEDAAWTAFATSPPDGSPAGGQRAGMRGSTAPGRSRRVRKRTLLPSRQEGSGEAPLTPPSGWPHDDE